MEPINLNLDKAKFLVDQAIKQRGEDYVYEKDGGSCLYVHTERTYDEYGMCESEDFENATPGCLVGLALIKAGVKMAAFKHCNDVGAPEAISTLADNEEIASVDDEALHYLTMVQHSQDNGATWGEARDAADRGKYIYMYSHGEKTGSREERELEWYR